MPMGIYKRTNKIRKILSEAHKGYKMPESQKQKIREASIRNGNKPPSSKGKKYSQEFKDAIKKRMLGVKKSKESIAKANLKRIGKKHSEEHKRKISEGLKGRVVSIETRYKIGKANSGKNNFHWKGGITKSIFKIRNSIEHKLWREAVFARDNWTCQKYGIKGGMIDPHHILNFAQYPDLRFDINNGITLSRKAHKEFHSLYGRKNNTREQLLEFLNL